MVQSLVHEVEVMGCCLATIPSFNPPPTSMDNFPSNHLLGCDVFELFDHYKKIQAELVQQSTNLAFLFDGYHIVLELQDCLKLQQPHDRANALIQARKDKKVIALLQAECDTQEKHITSLEDELDITCQENKVYQDELDEQQLLLNAFQSQLNRINNNIMAINLQSMNLNARSNHSPRRFSSPELYHSYKSDNGHTWLAPNTVHLLDPMCCMSGLLSIAS
ncbi:hypothetical protein DSO57_1036295 [Entomophthora muscae]|uniref:Uncharacterized protein n=1 Tax=Entomophthora muscae TaxID=34485 RepID=A0ACC2RE15_9FUNG|nr:hypothetical protein DSO57_1036295 [Entomophthora muscae]